MASTGNCTTCKNLYSRTKVLTPDLNTQHITYDWYCIKGREEFNKLVETKDERGFYCPEHSKR